MASQISPFPLVPLLIYKHNSCKGISRICVGTLPCYDNMMVDTKTQLFECFVLVSDTLVKRQFLKNGLVSANLQNVLIDQKHLQVQLQYVVKQGATVTN
jgi:hypothetical protein